MVQENITLITGASGKTGRRITDRLIELGKPVLAATRQSPSKLDRSNAIYFDWYDESTHLPALKNVDQLYLVAPVGDTDPAKVMIPFIKKALAQGVKRFVLLSSASISEEESVFGPVHLTIKRLAPEWAVLRPSYFMQNFTQAPHVETINKQNLIISATGQGKIGFVDVNDIAEVGVRALVDVNPHNTEHIITGPDILSYNEVSQIISDVTGRPIQHQSIPDEEFIRRWINAGLSKDYASFMTELERRIREEGTEAQVTETVWRVTGRSPISFTQFVQNHANAWKK
ncbi:ergot alkaloid biosynthesis protein [Jeotgalibacillus sp. S-D1]|uniref:NmrA family NAD(P)-binding protein n=1 Tax=Jeotgalibacillus sp. S-D1 TaxID=2552189 RepID=UPI001059DD8B|nr:NmrA family NAD(P)-binding protein [Jeotgalibacillus sp. S-D1]TDL31995.1 ergot alkaloid biosynthesis protein [Jeotgalibacillus sp. S-D1]